MSPTPTRLRLFTFLTLAAVMGTVSPACALGAVGDRGTMQQACSSPDGKLQKLCAMDPSMFDDKRGDAYVDLGSDFYLVAVTGLGTVGEGIYVGNVRTGRINMFGGYGFPELGENVRAKDGTLWIPVKRTSMLHGHFSEDQLLLQLRTNPITKLPYVLGYEVEYERRFLGEGWRDICADPGKRQTPECANVGKVILLYPDAIQQLEHRSPVDRAATQRILAAHQEALRMYQQKAYEYPRQVLETMERAHVMRILDAKPAAMSTDQYVRVLNDYAFFAYQWGEGRNDLAIELLHKVIELDPERSVAYLNMAQALEDLAKIGEGPYADTPLDHRAILQIQASAAAYRDKYRRMRAQPN